MGSLDYESKQHDGFEPIAIVGMGCRWPGDSESPSELWDFLHARLNAYSKFPADRIRTESFYHPNANRPGSFYTEGGAFLKSNVRNFDHGFFRIHPREVSSMDPPQRKFMEVVYEAFESSGTPLHALAGSKTGCFVGNFNYDHQLMQYRDVEYPEPYSATGGGITVLSNRANYIFDLRRPSMTLDTACSSSIHPQRRMHRCCCGGGSNLILTPECQIFSSVLGAVSPTSVCYTFDVAADGNARADGIGAMYIKSLSQAVKDGDPIRAIIRGTAINANGRTGGIAHPSADGQEAVMRRAYERAGGLDPALTGYFECHGTGAAVGDPLEVSAIGRVCRLQVSRFAIVDRICIMKAVLAIEKGVIPPIVGLKNLNPNIDLKEGAIKIVTESTPWLKELTVRRASIISFRYGGANSHTIIESVDSVLPGYRASRQVDARSTHQNRHANGHANGNGHANRNGHANGNGHYPRTKYLLPFSAHDEPTLAANVAALKAAGDSQWQLFDLAYTLSARRSQFSHRSFSIISADNSAALEKLAIGPVTKQPTATPTLGFVFIRQGAQWPGMGATLMKEFPVYLRTIRDLDAYLDTLPLNRSWSIEGVLRANADESPIYKAEISQPLVTATQITLVNFLADWGIRPSAVVGHSSSYTPQNTREIAAEYAAGLITQEEAMQAAYYRGRVVAQNSQEGLMLAAGLGADGVQPYLVTESPVDIMIEIGPHSALQGPLRQISQPISQKFPEYLSAIVRKNNNVQDTLTLAGNLFARGFKVGLARVNAAEGETPRIISDLPHYQWQYSDDILLHENRYTREWRLRTHPRHDMLGSCTPGVVKDEPVWRNMLRTKDLGWLSEHRVGQETVFPSTGYLAMALEAAAQMAEGTGHAETSIESYDILDVSLQKALIIPGNDNESIETLFTLRKAPLNNNDDYDSQFQFFLTSVAAGAGQDEEDGFVEHCRGTIQVNFTANDRKLLHPPVL
ncbi:thiolase-like protein [Thelonectria olida]|uniref:Thiolase-like protein n=1 Tax=Thelonectria olida TaxID=1576542 RepID=A0A9P8W7V7_9HYPO|nr:thiolase-like protein [Thelonectria olida]